MFLYTPVPERHPGRVGLTLDEYSTLSDTQRQALNALLYYAGLHGLVLNTYFMGNFGNTLTVPIEQMYPEADVDFIQNGYAVLRDAAITAGFTPSGTRSSFWFPAWASKPDYVIEPTPTDNGAPSKLASSSSSGSGIGTLLGIGLVAVMGVVLAHSMQVGPA